MVRVRHCLFFPFSSPFPFLFPVSSFTLPFPSPFLFPVLFPFLFSCPFSFPFPFLFLSFLFPFPFAFFFLFLSLSFSFPFPFPLPFLFFPFPSFTIRIPFPFPFPRLCEFFDQGVKPALGKTIRGKKDNVWKKTIWKGSGFLQTLILYIYIYIICHIILSIYHHYHIISRSHLARVGETVGSLATFTARRGREQLWSSELRCSGSSDGPEEAVEIRKALAEVTGAVWGSVGTCGNHSTEMDWEVCSTDLKLWQRWLTLWIFVKPLKLSRVELVKCNHHCLRFVGRGAELTVGICAWF